MIQEPKPDIFSSITGKGEWRPCPFESATAFQLGGKVYTAPHAQNVDNYVVFTVGAANTRIHKRDLAIFGIQPVEWVEEPLVDTVLEWTSIERNGMVYLAFPVGDVYHEGQAFISTIKGDRFRITEILGADS
jgi:hypothetical protein